MTLMSDRWIRQQCTLPTHVIEWPNGSRDFISPPFSVYQETLMEQSKAIDDFLNRENMVFSSGDFTQPYVREITNDEIKNWRPMISPFVNESVRRSEDGQKILSYGVSSYGYDARVAPEFRIFTNVNNTIIDPLKFDEGCYVEKNGDFCIIPPNSFVLTRTVERFIIPRDILVVVLTKSTMARVGTFSLATPLEPAWEGYVTLEFANTTNLPVKLHANMGGVQLLFLKGDEPCEVSYADKGGKYQNQPATIVNPKG